MSTEDYIKKYKSKDSTIYIATQSGPLLIGNGKYNPALNPNSKSKHIRNGVGINKKGEQMFYWNQQRLKELKERGYKIKFYNSYKKVTNFNSLTTIYLLPLWITPLIILPLIYKNNYYHLLRMQKHPHYYL